MMMDIGIALVLAAVIPSLLNLGVLYMTARTKKKLDLVHQQMNGVKDQLINEVKVAAIAEGKAIGVEIGEAKEKARNSL